VNEVLLPGRHFGSISSADLVQRPAPRGGPSPTGPRLGAAQHRDLVPQHEQFRILERRRTTQQDKPASKPHEDQIEQTQRHGRSSCPAATPHLSRQVTAIGRLLAPRGRIAAAPRPGRLLAPHRKTELAKAFGRWWRDTGGMDDPRFVFWHSFEPGVASFGPGGVITEIGLAVRRRLRGPAAR